MVDSLPVHVRTDTMLAETLSELFDRLKANASRPAEQRRLLNELLALQAQVLVRRLALGQAGAATQGSIDPVMLERYREYRKAVDQEFRNSHHVAPYALYLACSTKSLNRACQAASDVTAKRIIVERIILEVKRLHAHSSDTAAKISTEITTLRHSV